VSSDSAGPQERVAAIATAQARLIEQVEAVAEATQAGFAAQRRALAELRREVLGDRRAFAMASVFSAVAPALDSLQTIRVGLDADAALAAQTDAVTSALQSLLQSLGYLSFEAAVGQPFAPERMECLGHVDGPPGVVLAAVRPGYLAGDVVVRPAGVLLAAWDGGGDEGR
jgi:molecular chaperone GrpE (heat shock protein)